MEIQNKIENKSFKELTRRLILIGVWRGDSSARERILCLIKNCVILITFMSFFVTAEWFVIFSAKSTREITESSYFALTSLLCFIWYSILMWKRDKYANIIKDVDIINEQSK